jgi:protein-L-isoaspartate(D-aspartate) O-methyltransferase
LNSSFEDYAYQDKAFPIGTRPNKNPRCFSISIIRGKKKSIKFGTGSGYQTAVLCLLGAKVLVLKDRKNCSNKLQYYFQN